MISFIICTYNREKYIYECLSRLAKNTAKECWEIVLVNNNSTDQSFLREKYGILKKGSNYCRL